jgi:hypothetical protein
MEAFKFGIDIDIQNPNSPSSIEITSSESPLFEPLEKKCKSISSSTFNSPKSYSHKTRQRSFSDSPRWRVQRNIKYKKNNSNENQFLSSRKTINDDLDMFIMEKKINLSERNKKLIQRFINNKINYIYSKEYVYLNDMSYKTPEINKMIKWFNKCMNYHV